MSSKTTPEWEVAVDYEEDIHLPMVESVEEKWSADGMALVDEDGEAQIAAENPMSNHA